MMIEACRGFKYVWKDLGILREKQWWVSRDKGGKTSKHRGNPGYGLNQIQCPLDAAIHRNKPEIQTKALCCFF